VTRRNPVRKNVSKKKRDHAPQVVNRKPVEAHTCKRSGSRRSASLSFTRPEPNAVGIRTMLSYLEIPYINLVFRKLKVWRQGTRINQCRQYKPEQLSTTCPISYTNMAMRNEERAKRRTTLSQWSRLPQERLYNDVGHRRRRFGILKVL
jgi:hypothetical protein